MQKTLLALFLGFLGLGLNAQNKAGHLDNTLFWKVSGNGLTKPSYLFGTMHMICADDIGVSPQLSKAIGETESVYLELDMDNTMQIFGAVNQMSMKGDTSLSQLLSPSDYKKVKEYFESHVSMLPFNMLERFKPMLIQSMMMEQSGACDNVVIMENEIMKDAKKQGKEINGLETMKYQLSIFDSIPYRLQAQELVESLKDSSEADMSQMDEITKLYRSQQLEGMEKYTVEEAGGMTEFMDLLLYNRNRNWAEKLQQLMPEHPVVVAVGAGHLPGAKGLINLLRQRGYKVEPLKNDMIRAKTL